MKFLNYLDLQLFDFYRKIILEGTVQQEWTLFLCQKWFSYPPGELPIRKVIVA